MKQPAFHPLSTQPAHRFLALAILSACLALHPQSPSPDSPTNTPAPALTNSVSQPAASLVPSTNSVVTQASTNSPSRSDYAYYQPVNDRNIFNPKRVPNRPDSSGRPRRETRRAPKIDAFSLVGSLRYAKGDIAFFVGTSSSYKTAVKPGESIADHKVVAIDSDNVTLEFDGKSLVLPIGSQIRREEEGEWTLAPGVASATPTRSNSSSSGSSGTRSSMTASTSGDTNGSPGAAEGEDPADADDPEAGEETPASDSPTAAAGGSPADEVLKRLLQRREQEQKK
jgi:hypothetical protein